MNKTIKIVFCAVFLITSCTTDTKDRGSKIESNSKEKKPIKVITTDLKPNINVYLENSASMDGYVKGNTEFEKIIFDYLTNIQISNSINSLNLFYINSKILPQNQTLKNYISTLEPDNFKQKGGNRGITDIADVLQAILSTTSKSEIAIMITDGIFSPGKGTDAKEYIESQQTIIRKSFSDYLVKNSNTGIIIYQLYSKFEGCYYNKIDDCVLLKEERPFYIWIIGDSKHLKKITEEAPINKFKANFKYNSYSITKGNKTLKYAVKINSGNFNLSKSSPKTDIEKFQKDNRSGIYQFSVDADFSGLLLNEGFLTNPNSYDISNKSFNISITKSSIKGYTHTLNLTSSKIPTKGKIEVKLLSKTPQWVDQVNDDDGSKPIIEKTYGIKYQIEGVQEAFTFDNEFYTKITINIK